VGSNRGRFFKSLVFGKIYWSPDNVLDGCRRANIKRLRMEDEYFITVGVFREKY
jgi:hypothetical protein